MQSVETAGPDGVRQFSRGSYEFHCGLCCMFRAAGPYPKRCPLLVLGTAFVALGTAEPGVR